MLMERRLVIISGLSGAGKTAALHALEDIGFYCIDNLPLGILLHFSDYLTQQPDGVLSKVAVVIDSRNDVPPTIKDLPDFINILNDKGVKPELFFIDATTETLLRRYSATRRKHPASSKNLAISEAIEYERGLMDTLFAQSDLYLDTSDLNVHQLRERFKKIVTGRRDIALTLQFYSFGYKHGIPKDTDFVFDVRNLPNPYWEEGLRELTGLDMAVKIFLDNEDMANKMFKDIAGFLVNWLENFESDDRNYVTVAIGCTGGRHRSVYVAEKLADHFKNKTVLISHRDCQ